MAILSDQPQAFAEAAKSASVIDGPAGSLLLLGNKAFTIICPAGESQDSITGMIAAALRQSSSTEGSGQ